MVVAIVAICWFLLSVLFAIPMNIMEANNTTCVKTDEKTGVMVEGECGPMTFWQNLGFDIVFGAGGPGIIATIAFILAWRDKDTKRSIRRAFLIICGILMVLGIASIVLFCMFVFGLL